MIERLELDWHGPLRPAGMDISEPALDALDVPAIYGCMYVHPQVVRVYVGRTTSFVRRLREHVAATLGLTYWLYDEEGEPGYSPRAAAEYFGALADLDRVTALAAAEVRRMAWFHAVTEDLGAHGQAVLEGILIRHVKALEASGACDAAGRRVVSYNDRGGFAGEGEAIVTNRGAADWVALIGTEIRWGVDASALAHDE